MLDLRLNKSPNPNENIHEIDASSTKTKPVVRNNPIYTVIFLRQMRTTFNSKIVKLNRT